MKTLALILLLSACSTADVSRAKKHAQDFAQNIPNSTGVTCNASDSDGDGYVSCTVFRGDAEPLALSCGAEKWCIWNCAEGCKPMPMTRPSR